MPISNYILSGFKTKTYLNILIFDAIIVHTYAQRVQVIYTNIWDFLHCHYLSMPTFKKAN